MVNLLIFYYTFVYCIPSPFRCVSQWRFTGFGRQEFSDFRKFKRQAGFVDHIRHSVFVVNRERLTPVTLAGEDSVTQTVVHFHTAQIVVFYIFLGCFYRFFDSQSVQRKIAIRSNFKAWRVANDTFLGIETFFAYITTFYQRANFQSEMFGECIVAAIMCRYSHNSTCSVSGQYVIADPDGHCFTCERVDGIRAAEYTGNTTVGDTFAFRTFFGTVKVSIYFCFLFRSS